MIKPAPAIKVASVASSGEFQYPTVGIRAGARRVAEEENGFGPAEEAAAARRMGLAARRR
jgi:hypothetical protein